MRCNELTLSFFTLALAAGGVGPLTTGVPGITTVLLGLLGPLTTGVPSINTALLGLLCAAPQIAFHDSKKFELFEMANEKSYVNSGKAWGFIYVPFSQQWDRDTGVDNGN